jgi:hypothetical protein
MMLGNPLLPVLAELNAAFGGQTPSVGAVQSKAFAPGTSLGASLASVLEHADPQLNAMLEAYVATMPGGFRETLRAIIHYALTHKPQVLLTFAWAPAYDFELTIWEIVEPPPAHSGMTILLKGRYPDHADRFGR